MARPLHHLIWLGMCTCACWDLSDLQSILKQSPSAPLWFPVGPYKKLGEPILRADMGRNVIGPGACSVIRGNHGMDLMAYHSWDAPPPNNKYRAANVASVFWNGDIPSVVATWGQVGFG